jgi:hypothetical protein
MPPSNEPERLFPLDAVRADGWFERLGGGSAAFAQLCQVVGDKFVAFSIVAGLRITALQVDARSPERSLIEFGLGESGPTQRMALADFRRRLANALVVEDEPTVELPPDAGPEELQAFVGVRSVLLAPVLGIELLALRVRGRGAHGEADVLLRVDGVETTISLEDLRELVRDRIRAEADRMRTPEPFAIDLAAVPEAEAAAREGRHDRVVALLGGWPGPLSMILRTPEGHAITDEPRAVMVRGLGLLGSAYAALGRHDWAEDVLRLGIQWGGDGPATGELFRRLGEALLSADRAGEAIGLLRRALALGSDDPEHRSLTLAALARAFAVRQRYLAALVCAEDAIAAGASDAAVRAIREEAIDALGDRWSRVRALLGDQR